ncbi:MAG: glycoside hydrolase family 2, partial [Planctomycetes bacterium]|nr:glycoside hydrolase family 2 [Planctomycetota bacterium]
VCGWLYTEHHDVINEWNGYWRYDRSRKFTGLSDMVEGMTIRDFHSPFYIAMARELCTTVRPGQWVDVPLYASFMTDQAVDEDLTLDMSLFGWNSLGVKETYWHGSRQVLYRPWMHETLAPESVKMPTESALAILAVTLKQANGDVLHRNFTTYQVTDGPSLRQATVESGSKTRRLVRFGAKAFTDARWSLKQWNVLDGLKVNGAGSGYFEYEIPWPEDLALDRVKQATLKLEVSSKQLFGKDRKGATKQDGDFMRGKGTH